MRTGPGSVCPRFILLSNETRPLSFASMRFSRSKKISDELATFARSELDVSSLIAAVASRRADGLPVDPRSLPICVGAATLHADTVSAMPARSAAATSPRVRMLLESPDPTTDYRSFIAQCVTSMYWEGFAPLLLDRPAPFTSSVRLLSAAHTHFDPTDAVWRYNGETIAAGLVYSVNLIEDVTEGVPGTSPLRRCWQALSMYGYAYRYLIDYFAQGGNPSSILRTNHPVNGERATELVDEWITARAHRRPAVMDPTVSLEVPPSSGELQATLSVLDYASSEIGRLLNVPPSLLNAPALGSSMTYSNTSDETRRWIALSLNPTWMARLESMFRTVTGDPTIQLDPAPLLELYNETADAQKGDRTDVGQ